MKIRNWTLLLTLSALACLFYFYFTPGFLHPAEDATILFNYAQNLKETGIISYYPGGPKVDGSTDFLFMLFTTFCMHFVSNAYTAALVVSGVSTLLMLFLIFKLLDTKSNSLQYLALFLIVFSQQIWAAVLGYGTFFYAMLICWTVFAYWKGSLGALSFVSFLAFMARPDALITVLPLMLHKLYKSKGSIGQKLLQPIAYFGIPSSIYLAFRWWYFGSLLPLSFDINTAGNDKVWGLFPIHSIYHVQGYILHYIYPGIIGLFIYFAKSKFKIKSEYYVLIFSMIIFPLAAYMTIRENLDFAHRYFIIPYLGLLITMSLLIRNYKSIILSIFGILLLVKVGSVSIDQGKKSLNHYYNNIYDLATELSQYPQAKLATSEAGIIAWKSRWKTLDVWGLNTPSLTNRVINRGDLLSWNADLIYIHAAEVDYVYVPEDSLLTVKNWLTMTHHVVNTMYQDQYLTYLVPYDLRFYKDVQFENVGLFKSLLKYISENKVPKNEKAFRQELFAIRPDSPYKAELMQVIEKYGGKRFYIQKKDKE